MSGEMRPSNNMIAIVCIVGAVGLTVYIFAASRTDAGLRMASLVSSTSIAAALITIASTILIGKDAMQKKDVADLPPGSRQTETSTLQTPPLPPTVTTTQENPGG